MTPAENREDYFAWGPKDIEIFDLEPKHETSKAGNGVMIAWFVPAELAAQLAIPDGEKPEELHVTLGYFGKAVSESQLKTIREQLTTIAQKYAPLQGKVGGIGRFPASESSDGKDVIIELVDVARLESLREEILRELEVNSVPAVRTHGYTPHITLAYVDPTYGTKQAKGEEHPITIDRLTLAIGGTHEEYLLTGPEQLQKYNENHDELGEFASSDGSKSMPSGVAFRGDKSKQFLVSETLNKIPSAALKDSNLKTVEFNSKGIENPTNIA
jgi:2'-5' RNA ligase